MAKTNDTDLQKVLHLLRAALGDINPKQPLHKLFAKAPQCGPFEWMLSILAMEIDLRVNIPEKLADNRDLTAEAFAAKVAALPKIDFPTYTLDCLALVAQALLSLESEDPSTTARLAGSRRRAKATTAERSTKSGPRPRAASLESAGERKVPAARKAPHGNPAPKASKATKSGPARKTSKATKSGPAPKASKATKSGKTRARRAR
jgi:hypothetical protein